MDEPTTLHIQLNANAVAETAQRVVTVASQVVATLLRALAKDDLSQQELQGEFMGYQFGGAEWADEDRRETFNNWILSKGFQDLARGVRECLETALLYLDVLKLKPGRTTQKKFEAEIASLRARAAKLQFPELLKIVNAGLIEPLTFEAEFLTLQKARNCLEHRGGRVSARDLDPAGGTLILSFPRIRMFYRRGDEPIELVPGEVIDTQSENGLLDEGQTIPIFVDRVTRTREYRLGQPVVITASDFAEIAMACHIFAGDLASKLPTVTPAAPEA